MLVTFFVTTFSTLLWVGGCKPRQDNASDVQGTDLANSFMCNLICEDGDIGSAKPQYEKCPADNSALSCDRFNVLSTPLNCRYRPASIDACDKETDNLVYAKEQIDTTISTKFRKIDKYSVFYHNFDLEKLSNAGKAGLQAMVNLPIEELALPLSFTKQGNKSVGNELALWFKRGQLPSPFPDQYNNGLTVSNGHNKFGFRTESETVEEMESTNINCALCHVGSIGYVDQFSQNRALIAVGIPNKDLNIPKMVSDDFAQIEGLLGSGMVGMAKRKYMAMKPYELTMVKNTWDVLKNVHLHIFKDARTRGAAPLAQAQNAEGPYWSKKDLFTSAPILPHPTQTRMHFIDRFNASVKPTMWWSNKHKQVALWVPYVMPRNDPEVGFDQQVRDFTYVFQHADTGNYRMKPSKKYAYMKKIFDYIKEVTSPRYPLPLDRESVKRGSEIFHDEAPCAGCHGKYKNYENFGDGAYKVCYSQWLEDAGTDPEYRKQVDGLGAIWEHINEAKANPKMITYDTSKMPPGYLPPVLDGIWVGAPYFHNGSVPNLTAVLNSTHRPAKWAQYSPVSYEVRNEPHNSRAIGLLYKEGAATPDYPLYDTTQRGYSNKGHEFGDSLTGEERRQVIDFLLDISGPKVIPDPDRIPKGETDQFTLSESNKFSVSDKAEGVLKNDKEGCAGGMTAKLSKAGVPAHGKLTLNLDGTFSYVPKDNYKGEDFFKYRVFSGQYWSKEIKVNLTIQ